MNPESPYYIGIMSGTSADAIDLTLINTHPRISLLSCHSKTIPSELQRDIHFLADPSQNASIDHLGELDQKLGHAFADAVLELLNKTQIPARQIAAIGSHGQTVRHRPSGKYPFSLQIGDPNIIAARTGITTVADFRRRDMATGGQGAPLVPGFHQAVFSSETSDRVVVNIGGMANITWLPKTGERSIMGFDTGPGNVLLDAWIHQTLQQKFDCNGAWAAQGKLNTSLLNLLLTEEFFQQAPPKSTGREMFNLRWLGKHLEAFQPAISAVDVQRTLLELTAKTIVDSIQKLSSNRKQIFVCGGGAFNQLLMQRLQDLLTPDTLASTATLGIEPQWVEAMAFAWLAHQRMHNKTGNICAVTGAKSTSVLGAIYFGS